MKINKRSWVRRSVFGLTASMLVMSCLGISGCPKADDELALETPRAEAIADSGMDRDKQQQILAGAAMNLQNVGHLRFARPDLLMEIVRPPLAIEQHDFTYHLFFDQYEGVYWISESLPRSHGPKWYGPLFPNDDTIEALTPEDYVPPVTTEGQ